MFLPTLLKASEEDEALKEAYSLELNDDEAEPTNLDPQLGQAVPISWHHTTSSPTRSGWVMRRKKSVCSNHTPCGGR